MKTKEEIGSFKIYLPDENTKQFCIFCDLAEITGHEYQSDATSKLKKKLNEVELQSKPSIDYESDRTSIRTSNYRTIIEVAKIIDHLATNNFKAKLTKENWAEIEQRLKNWKRPKPHVWKENDIFSMCLKDGSYAFGQVLTKEKYRKTFALFDFKSEKQEIDISQLKKAEPITILHLMGLKLNDGSWNVIGNSNNRLANPIKGPWGDNYGKSGSDSCLESIANYYWFGECKWKNEADLKKLIIKKSGLLNKIRNWW